MEIKIDYDGSYPTLCSGNLVVTIDKKKYKFDSYSLCSGGRAYCDSEGDYVIKGLWSVNKYPKNFPEELKEIVLDAINDKIPHGCCGGCI